MQPFWILFLPALDTIPTMTHSKKWQVYLGLDNPFLVENCEAKPTRIHRARPPAGVSSTANGTGLDIEPPRRGQLPAVCNVGDLDDGGGDPALGS